MNQDTSQNLVETGSISVVDITPVAGEDSVFASLGASLAEIRKLEGVTGYILKGSTTAVVDCPEIEKVSLYALLSYQLYESSLEIAKQLSVAQVESVLVEGRDLKVLFIRIGENSISVFMEKGASHSWIIKRILI